jgi:hypothetical protein
MTDYNALIAEARLHAGMARMEYTDVANTLADVIDRLAAALRELLAPPPGWRVTEWTREDGARAVLRNDGNWHSLDKNDFRVPGTYATAAAAMAALEEKENG